VSFVPPGGALVEVRALSEPEVPRYLEIARYGFRDWTDDPSKDEDPAWFPVEEMLGLFDGQSLVSGLVVRRFRQSVRGTKKLMGGVAGVATLPEWRGRGCVKTLFRFAFGLMRQAGRPVTMLHPFRESFYEQFGYVAAEAELWLGVPLEALAHYLRRTTGPGLDLFRRHGREGLARFLAAVADREALHNGYVLSDEASPTFWARRLRNAVYVFVESGGRVRAAAAYRTLLKTETPELRVMDWYWSDPESRDALFGYMASHRDQVSRLHFPVPPRVPFHQWLRDTMTPYRLRVDEKPWMVRIVDVVGALEGVPAALDQELLIAVKDPWCGWNNRCFRLGGRKGWLRVEPAGEEQSAAEAAVEVDIRGLSALLYGTLDREELVHRGWLRGAEIERLCALLPPEPFYNPTYF
jgi:predicted acetyltransferase